jgi:P4 family phage/plasmid primase-like protien
MYASKVEYLKNISDDYQNKIHIAVAKKKGFMFQEFETREEFWEHYKTFDNKTFYEIIALDDDKPLPVRPYLDVEYYDSDVTPFKFIAELKKEITSFCKEKIDRTPTFTIMNSSGFCTEKQCEKNSFHIIIRKIGLCNNVYECSLLVKQLVTYIKNNDNVILTQRKCEPSSEERSVPIDMNVYKNKWQTMRLPYSIKGSRELLPISGYKNIPFNKIKDNIIDSMFITTKHYKKLDRIDVSQYKPKEKVKSYVTQTIETNKKENKLIDRLLECYLPKRCEKYRHWIRIGIALHNYFKGSNEGFSVWCQWSQKCPEKFDLGVCKKKWKEFEKTNLKYNIGSLIYWAKRDNPEQFTKIIAVTYTSRAYYAINNDYRTAELIYDICKNEFVGYIDEKSNTYWYWFNGVHLVPDHGCMRLKKQISVEIVSIYERIKQHYEKKIALTEEEADIEAFKKKIKACDKMVYKLSSNGYKKCLIDECRQFFMRDELPKLMNTNPDILVFNNGVYDLNELCFRGGCPEDLTNLSCKINYKPNQDTSDIKHFLKSVLYYDEVVHYTCKLLASCCSGRINDQLFHFLTGVGSNGKSTLLNIIDEAFGQYYTVTDATTLIGKDNNAGQASPHMYKLLSKRLVGISESSDGCLNIERFKKITGNDKISIRGLYKEEEDIRLQCKFLMISNQPPNVPSHDYATWRRIRCIDCQCKFVDNPTKEKEFKKDPRLANQSFIKQLASQLMTLLLETYYPLYLKEGLRNPPKFIVQSTDNYSQRTNPYHMYAAEKIVKSTNKDDYVDFKKLYNEFKSWFMATESPFIRKKFPNSMNEIKNNFSKYYFKCEPEEVTMNGKKNYIWRNFSFNEHFTYEFDDF